MSAPPDFSGGVLRRRVDQGPLAGARPQESQPAGPAQLAKAARDILGEDDSDEDIDRMDQELEARGLGPDQRVQGYRQEAQQYVKDSFASELQRVQQTYREEAQQVRARAEAERKAQARSIQLEKVFAGFRGDRPVSTREQRIDADLDRGLGAAQEARDLELEGLQLGRVAAREDRAQASAAREQETARQRAQLVADLMQRNGMQVPSGALDNPEAFVSVYGDAAGKLAEPEGSGFNEEEYRRKKSIDQEFAPEAKRGAFTPNKQVDLLQRADKYDRTSRQVLQSLDRGLDTRISGAKDIELLYNFIARMDNTAAREGELQLAQRAQNLRDRIERLVGGLTEGQLIGSNLREQIREQLEITRRQVQEDRQLTLGGLRDIAGELGATSSLTGQLDRLLEYGQESTVPGAEAESAPSVQFSDQAAAEQIRAAFQAGEIDRATAKQRLQALRGGQDAGRP